MFTIIASKTRDVLGDVRGATAVEYAIMIAFIAIVIFAAVATFGLAVRSLFASWPGL